MIIDFDKIAYAVLGGVSLIAVEYVYKQFYGRFSGRNVILKYSTVIKRHARLRREIESIIERKKDIKCIIMQGIDAAYIAMAGKDPSVAILHVRRGDDAALFRNCLNRLKDPDEIFAIATGKRAALDKNDKCEEFNEGNARNRIESTWFRPTHGRDSMDEKVDDAMLEQVMSLTESKDKDLSQSGACHIAIKVKNQDDTSNIIVMPTSFSFRKAFKKEYGEDDLTRFNTRDLLEKILHIRQKISGAH